MFILLALFWTCKAHAFNSFSAPDQFVKITVLLADDQSPLSGAVVRINPLNTNDSKIKAISAITDLNGSYIFQFFEPVIVRVSYLGFSTIVDTVYSAQSKVFMIRALSQNIKDVVVTGQYGSANSQKSVYEVQVIDNDMLRAKGATNLREALQDELHIDFYQDQVYGTSIGLNGVSEDGVKIMIDGVPIVGRLDGILDLSQVDISNIDHIEIVEGPLSVVYGTDAMGGVINIITKTYQKEKINLNLKAYYESVGQYNVELSGGFHFKRSQIYFSGGRNFFNGFTTLDSIPRYQEWKPKEQYFADAKYIYTGNRFRFTVSGSFFRELMIDRSPPMEGLEQNGNGTSSWTYYGLDAHYLTYRPMASASLMYKFKEGTQFDALVSYSGFLRYTNNYYKDLTTGQQSLVVDPSNPNDTTRDNLFTLRSTYNMPAWKDRLNFLFGIEVNQEFESGSTLSGGDHYMGDYASFGSARISVLDGLDIQPAIRFSYNTIFNVPLIPSLNIRYNYKNKLVLRASYGRGYRAPSLKELYLNFFDSNHAIEGNPNLTPEDGNCLRGSVSYTIPVRDEHKITFTTSGYYNNISNKIDFEEFLAPFPPDTYQYINIKRSITYGGQETISYRWKRLTLSAAVLFSGYNYQIVEQTNNNDIDKATAWSQDFTATASYVIPKAGITINVYYKYDGAKPLFTVNGDVETGSRPAYNMMDLSVSRNFWKDRIQLTIGGKNLFGVTNLIGTNVSGVAFAHSATPNVLNIAWGRTFFTTLILHFGK